MKAPEKSVPVSEIEDEYRAFPTRFVREAQQGLEDGTYDEAWAVFDGDGHPRHEEAFALADVEINGKRVNIAFSNISFEHWVLLHFEKNNAAFEKSECKERGKSIDCGTGNHADDCNGNRCVSGHLKVNEYLRGYSKNSKIDLYTLLKGKTDIAIKNASWLRNKIQDLPIYHINPFTNVDVLVKRLLKIERNIIWMNFDSVTITENLSIELNRKPAYQFSINVTNNKSISHVLNWTMNIYSDNEVIHEIKLPKVILEPEQLYIEQIEIEATYLNLPNKELFFNIDEKELLIIDLG